MTAKTLLEHVALDQLSENEFVSQFHPGWMGNIALIAYGGCTLAIGVAAACQTVSNDFHLYSSNGNYLGPAQTDRKYFCKVSKLRDTRTFATRYVEVSQELDNGTKRLCLSMLADFQVQEPGTMLSYSAPPSEQYPSPTECKTFEEHRADLVNTGKITQGAADAHAKTFAMMKRTFENRIIPQSILHQTLSGIAKHLPTPQDALPLPSKKTMEWLRARDGLLKSQTHNVSSLAFNLDGALSFLPLTHSRLSLQDAGPCSSLDFALRIFSNNVDLNQWHLKELKTHHGSNGRTYSEARLWDEKGNLVALLTQMNILRPKPPPKESKAKSAL